MRSFFRGLERTGVEYVLISGQAAILYGASTFSEDFDLWVRPTTANLVRLRAALRAVDGRVYKLTPPLTLANARFGHGFHFTVPDDAGGEAYIDVMGRPPRVGSFTRARARSQVFRTDWGALPVVGVEDLVLLKLTRRLADYDVISNLVALRVQRSERRTARLFAWALASTFRAEDVVAWIARYPAVSGPLRACGRRSLRPVRTGRVDERAVAATRRALGQEIAARQADDVEYWRPIIEDLRRLRQDGALLELGQSVE